MRISYLILALLFTALCVTESQAQYTRFQKVPFGGTGATTLTANGVVIGEGTNPVHITASGSAGQIFVSGGTGVDPTWQTISSKAYLTVDTASTTQSLVGTPLKFTVDSNSVWEFDAFLRTGSSSSAGIEFGVTVPSGGTVYATTLGSTTGVTAFSTDIISASATAGLAYNTVNAATGVIQIHGIITTAGTAGTVVVGFLKVTSGTATIGAKSYLVARKLN